MRINTMIFCFVLMAFPVSCNSDKSGKRGSPPDRKDDVSSTGEVHLSSTHI